LEHRLPLLIAIGAVVAIGVGIAVAYTAANTVPASRAGEGAGVVSGYTITNVHYALKVTDPTKIDAVEFTLDTAPVAGSTVRLKLVSAGTTWYTCTNVGVTITCGTTSPQATVVTADELKIVVAQ
jgi:hypothetical protein